MFGMPAVQPSGRRGQRLALTSRAWCGRGRHRVCCIITPPAAPTARRWHPSLMFDCRVFQTWRHPLVDGHPSRADAHARRRPPRAGRAPTAGRPGQLHATRAALVVMATYAPTTGVAHPSAQGRAHLGGSGVAAGAALTPPPARHGGCTRQTGESVETVSLRLQEGGTVC